MPESASLRQLAAVAEDLAAARHRFAQLDARTSDAAWALRPASDSWSVAECISHLNLTAEAMVPRIRAAIEHARTLPPVGTRGYRPSLLGRLLAGMLGPAPVVLGVTLGRSRTPAAFVPGTQLGRAQVTGEFRKWQQETAALVGAATGLALDRTTIESPFVANTVYDGYSALRIVARHEHRHLAQAERALAKVSP
jgi:hypothetical protein